MEENNNQNMNQEINENVTNQNVDVKDENVEPEKKNETSRNKNLIIVILSLIVLMLALYIIDDKFIHNKPAEVVPPKDEEKVPGTPTSKDEEKVPEKPTSKDDKYIKEVTKVVPLNGKNVTLDFKFFISEYIEELGEEIPKEKSYYLTYDLFMNNKKINDSEVWSWGYLFDGNYTETEAKEKALNENGNTVNEKVAKIDSLFGKIKGDKEYLYIKYVSRSGPYEASDVDIFDELGNKILTENMYSTDRSIVPDNTCPNYDKFTEARAYIAEDAIYVLADKGGCGDEAEMAPEYKITFSNGKAIKEKIADCKVTPEGAC